MTPDTAKTTEKQGKWTLVYGGSIKTALLVRIVRSVDGGFEADLNRALSDPANVYEVSAYPKAVEACEIAKIELEAWLAARGDEPEHDAAWCYLNAALAAVHPEGAET